jgi:hypothetical protein
MNRLVTVALVFVIEPRRLPFLHRHRRPRWSVWTRRPSNSGLPLRFENGLVPNRYGHRLQPTAVQPVNLTRLAATAVQTLLAAHVEQRCRLMKPFQQGSLKLAGVYPTCRACLSRRAPVLPASCNLIGQSGSCGPLENRPPVSLTNQSKSIGGIETPTKAEQNPSFGSGSIRYTVTAFGSDIGAAIPPPVGCGRSPIE